MLKSLSLIHRSITRLSYPFLLKPQSYTIFIKKSLHSPSYRLLHYNNFYCFSTAETAQRHSNHQEVDGNQHESSLDAKDRLEYYENLLSSQLADNLSDLTSKKNLANTYHKISKLHWDLNNTTEAIKNAEKALDVALQSFEESDLDTAKYYISLGEKISLEGHAEAAIDKINKGLYIQLLALGMRHPAVGKTYMDLGMVHQARGLLFEALESYMKSLEVYENCQEGIHDEDIATLYEFIGDVYCEENRFEEAVGFYEESIKIGSRNSHNEGSTLGLLYRKLGDCYAEVLKFEDAKVAYTEAAKMYKKMYGETGEETLEVIQQLGNYALQSGSFDEALDAFNEALRMYRLRGESNTFEVVEVYKSVASAAFQKGDYKSSIEYDKRVLDFYTQERLLGRTDEIYERIAEAYRKDSDKIEAVRVYREGLERHLEYFGTDYPAVEKFSTQLRDLYAEDDDLEQIKELDQLIAKFK